MTNKKIPDIIQASELLKLYKSENLIIADVSNHKTARNNYEEKHLDGALFVDMDTQLADIKQDLSNGGRHPLPSITKFSQTLSDLGITKDSHVILYDDKNGANAAARFWWMLKAAGHEKVQVLNGGLTEAEKAGFPVNSKISVPVKTELYKIENWHLPIADIDEVEKKSGDKNYMVIDVRDKERYEGKTEPIDLIAGHIPGAINVPYTENFNKDGLFLSPDELKTKYQKVFGDVRNENIIVHCGSGITACHTILAIAYAGFDIPELYVGSWSEWSRNNKEIAVSNK
ncbi:MAG: sulfurtransferase [Sphingobacteriales bacterium]